MRFFQLRMTFNLAWRNVTRSKYRSFLLILGILLTVALETGIAVSVDTLFDDFLLKNRDDNYTDITVNPVTWQDSDSLEGLAKEVRQISGVSKASPVLFLSVNQFVSQQLSGNILVYGVDSKNHPDMAHLNLISGSKTLQSNTIIISEYLSEASGFKVGDSVDLSSVREDLNIIRVTIGGIISDESFIGNKIGVLFILVDFKTLLRAIPEGLRTEILTQEIDVSVKDLLRIKGTAEKIEDRVGLNNYVFVEKDISDIKSAGIRAYQTAMNLVIMASFVVEFLFITNILAIAIRDRQKEFGILRATGASSWQFIKLIAVEVLMYAIIGSTLGILVGIGFSQVLVYYMDNYYTSIEFQSISLHFSSIFATFMSGIIVALVSGLYPIFLAKTLPVIQNIHSRMTTAKSHNIFTVTMWKYTLGAGISLAITAFILQIFIGPSRYLDFSLLSTHFLVVIMIFLGTLLIEIGILVFLPRVAMRVLFWFDIITRTISIRNIDREFQKSLFTIMTAALALTFIITVGTVSAAIVKEVPTYFQSQWGGIDAIVEAPDDNLFPLDKTPVLESRSSIAKAAFIQEKRTQIGSTNGYVYGVDPTQYSFFAEPILTSDYDLPSYLILNTSTTNEINALVSRILFQKLHLPLGSSIPVKIADNSTVNITLAAVIKPNIFLGSGDYLYLNSSHFQNYFNSTMAKWYLCKESGESLSIEGAIEIALPEFKEITEIKYIAELMEGTLIFQSAIFQVLFIESFILAAIAQFVCILISTLHMEREMGIMRSFGLSKGKVFSIFMCESTALGITALIVGLIDGVLGSILLIWYISQSIPLKFYLPPERVVFWVVISFLITIASTIVPSYRSSQKNLVATISGRPMRESYVEKTEQELLPQKWEIQREKDLSTVYSEPTEIRTSFQIGKSILKANKRKILRIYCVIMVVCVFNYILDSHIY
ncbi:MAG: ABC transporter permease, partial [Candidatus Hodarchaeales archaeon]